MKCYMLRLDNKTHYKIKLAALQSEESMIDYILRAVDLRMSQQPVSANPQGKNPGTRPQTEKEG